MQTKPSKTTCKKKWATKCLTAFSAVAFMTTASAPWQSADACSRILYETGNGTYIVGRGMDWSDPTARTALWVFPRGMKRDGTGRNPVRWAFGKRETNAGALQSPALT